MTSAFQIEGNNAAAPFKLKIHRGDGMVLLAMDWRNGKPPASFVGFAIEYREPKGDRFYAIKNRLGFPLKSGGVDPNKLSTLRSPIQKFRWTHFPRHASREGDFRYRVTPVFMNDAGELSQGECQTADLELRRETYRNRLNVTFTRGIVSSQAFVDRFASAGSITRIIPSNAESGLKFKPTHPGAKEALHWMGFEAREEILGVLDEAIRDKKAQVRVVAYDLNEPEVVNRLKQLGNRLRIIIDDDGAHGTATSAESQAAAALRSSAGAQQVKRQHMGKLQHNKTIVVNGPKVKAVVCGSTNFSWRGFYVQANNALVLRGASAVAPFLAAFDAYWAHDTPSTFGTTSAAGWTDLGLAGITARVSFSPHVASNALLEDIAGAITTETTSSLLYSLAFLYQTPGALQQAIKKVASDDKLFVYGISDRKVGGLDLQKPDGNVAPVYPQALTGKNVPEPFRSEPVGGSGNRMHHKFVVVDFDRPTAKVYLGSYNFSIPADTKNGENLLLIEDRKIAVSYAIEALRLFDHYHFRVAQMEAKKARTRLQLAPAPRSPNEAPWWEKYYTDPRRVRDRKLFST